MKKKLLALNWKPLTNNAWIKDQIELIILGNEISIAKIDGSIKDRKLYKGEIPKNFESFISKYN